MNPILVGVLLLAVAVVFACCLLFVAHGEYHAGLVGNVGFGLVATAAFARLMGLIDRPDVHISPQGVLLWLGLSLVLGRQAWRFLARLRSGTTWYDWRRSC